MSATAYPAAPLSAPDASTAKVLPFRAPSKRPRPVMRVVRDAADLAWDPVAMPLYVQRHDAAEGEPTTRAGEAFAIVRPSWERWPLGIVSDHYRVTPHRTTIAQMTSFCAQAIEPIGRPMIAGHGYHVAHAFAVRHMRASEIEGAPLLSRLVVAHDHTGVGALRALLLRRLPLPAPQRIGPLPVGAARRRAVRDVASHASEDRGMSALSEKQLAALASLRKAGLVARTVLNRGVRGEQATVYTITDAGRAACARGGAT